ncbi:hypothetical protein MtrunA17_Chr1g0186471 [Medicago truncatula]|uniref:Transmembrane protein n=1 Tax=Medicago truncatula TaxID=3880 RepID=A0A396JVL9_MEDTR|nr:hypothetical protein MtrunA17_Chr1g0186471 [Medicago truncatula]
MYSWNIHLSQISVFIYFLSMVLPSLATLNLPTFLNNDVINEMNM